MVVQCPKCTRTIPDDSVYCPYCGHGLKPWAKTIQVSTGSTLLMVSTASNIVLFALSVKALLESYRWYPPLVLQNWIIYIQLLTVFTFAASAFGLLASILSLIRRNYTWTMVSAFACTLLSLGSVTLSVLVPAANWGTIVFSFFFPILFPAMVGTALIFPKKAEFRLKRKQSLGKV